MIVILFLAWLIAKIWWLLAIAACAAALGRGIGWWLAHRDDLTMVARHRAAEMRTRADRQHAAILAGNNLVGVYGDYPPAV